MNVVIDAIIITCLTLQPQNYSHAYKLSHTIKKQFTLELCCTRSPMLFLVIMRFMPKSKLLRKFRFDHPIQK